MVIPRHNVTLNSQFPYHHPVLNMVGLGEEATVAHILLTSASIQRNWKMEVNCSKPPRAAQPPGVMLEEGSLANTSISIINWGRGGERRGGGRGGEGRGGGRGEGRGGEERRGEERRGEERRGEERRGEERRGEERRGEERRRCKESEAGSHLDNRAAAHTMLTSLSLCTHTQTKLYLRGYPELIHYDIQECYTRYPKLSKTLY